MAGEGEVPSESSSPGRERLLSSSYLDSDSDFVDFTQEAGRKSNLFTEDKSSLSLLASRFTYDKYLTPSVVGYDEYRAVLESGHVVEEELENVLGKKELGGDLPPPSSYKYVIYTKFCLGVVHFFIIAQKIEFV